MWAGGKGRKVGLEAPFGFVAGWPRWLRAWRAWMGWRRRKTCRRMWVPGLGQCSGGVLARFEMDGGTCGRFVRLLRRGF